MNNFPKTRLFRIFAAILGSILTLGLIYLIIFYSAFQQKENHLGIALAIPKLLFNSGAVRVDDETYLATSNASFINLMKKQGFTKIDQLGSLYIFSKDGKVYDLGGRMYTGYFMIFDHPKENIYYPPPREK